MEEIMTKKERVSHYVVLVLLAVFILTPFVLGLWTSFLPTADISSGSLFSTHVSLDNYANAIKNTAIIRYLLNSLVISVLTTVFQLVFCSMSAYAFVFLKFKGRDFLFGLFLATMMLPFEAEVIPNFSTMRHLNLLNTYSVMIIPFLTSAFGTFMLRQNFRQIPAELKEAADVCGLSHWKFYTKVTLPYSKISLLTLASYSFLSSWNQYLWPMLTTFSDRFRPVQDGLRQLQSQETFNDWGMIQASAAIVVIPTLIVLFIGQKSFKSGINEGAVK